MELDDFGQRILDGLTRERLLALLASFFGALATLLATVGLYGMVRLSHLQRVAGHPRRRLSGRPGPAVRAPRR